MKTKLMIFVLVIVLISSFSAITLTAGGPPLKKNACASCHKDYNAIFPKSHPDMGKGEACLSCHSPDPANKEAAKFSTAVHQAHKEGKGQQQCSACHAP